MAKQRHVRAGDHLDDDDTVVIRGGDLDPEALRADAARDHAIYGGNKYRRRQVQVAVVADTVEISIDEELIRSHGIKHDRTREHGALANPGGRPNRINAA